MFEPNPALATAAGFGASGAPESRPASAPKQTEARATKPAQTIGGSDLLGALLDEEGLAPVGGGASASVTAEPKGQSKFRQWQESRAKKKEAKLAKKGQEKKSKKELDLEDLDLLRTCFNARTKQEVDKVYNALMRSAQPSTKTDASSDKEIVVPAHKLNGSVLKRALESKNKLDLLWNKLSAKGVGQDPSKATPEEVFQLGTLLEVFSVQSNQEEYIFEDTPKALAGIETTLANFTQPTKRLLQGFGVGALIGIGASALTLKVPELQPLVQSIRMLAGTSAVVTGGVATVMLSVSKIPGLSNTSFAREVFALGLRGVEFRNKKLGGPDSATFIHGLSVGLFAGSIAGGWANEHVFQPKPFENMLDSATVVFVTDGVHGPSLALDTTGDGNPDFFVQQDASGNALIFDANHQPVFHDSSGKLTDQVAKLVAGGVVPPAGEPGGPTGPTLEPTSEPTPELTSEPTDVVPATPESTAIVETDISGPTMVDVDSGPGVKLVDVRDLLAADNYKIVPAAMGEYGFNIAIYEDDSLTTKIGELNFTIDRNTGIVSIDAFDKDLNWIKDVASSPSIDQLIQDPHDFANRIVDQTGWTSTPAFLEEVLENLPEPTNTATPEATATATATSTAEPTNTATVEATATQTASPTTTATPSPTDTGTPSPTAEATPTATPEVKWTPTPPATATPEATAEPQPTPYPTPTTTPEPPEAPQEPVVPPEPPAGEEAPVAPTTPPEPGTAPEAPTAPSLNQWEQSQALAEELGLSRPNAVADLIRDTSAIHPDLSVEQQTNLAHMAEDVMSAYADGARFESDSPEQLVVLLNGGTDPTTLTPEQQGVLLSIADGNIEFTDANIIAPVAPTTPPEPGTAPEAPTAPATGTEAPAGSVAETGATTAADVGSGSSDVVAPGTTTEAGVAETAPTTSSVDMETPVKVTDTVWGTMKSVVDDYEVTNGTLGREQGVVDFLKDAHEALKKDSAETFTLQELHNLIEISNTTLVEHLPVTPTEIPEDFNNLTDLQKLVIALNIDNMQIESGVKIGLTAGELLSGDKSLLEQAASGNINLQSPVYDQMIGENQESALRGLPYGQPKQY